MFVSATNQVALVVKSPPAHAGNLRDAGSIPRLGRSPGEGNGNPLQYSCLENPMDRGAWWATIHGVTKGQAQLKRLSRHASTLPLINKTYLHYKYFTYMHTDFSVSTGLHSMHACSVAYSFPATCDPMDCSPPGSSVHGISQTRLVEWIAISSSRWLVESTGYFPL